MGAIRAITIIGIFCTIVFLVVAGFLHTQGFTNKELSKIHLKNIAKAQKICEDRKLIFASVEFNNTNNVKAICVNKKPFSVQRLNVK